MAHSSFTSEEDFAFAYDHFADVIFRHCYLRTFSREKAKELMTEAFTRLWAFIADGNYVDSMQLFLYRICNQIIEEERVTLETENRPAGMDEEAQQSPEFAVLQKLNPVDRSVLVLHYVDGFSLPEIESILGGSAQEHAIALRNGTSFISSLISQ